MMSLKTLVFLVTVLAATTVSAASSDPVMWLWERAWPKAQKQYVPVTPTPAAKPKATRSIEHRKVHRPGPKITKREAAPLPRVRAPAAIIRPEKRERVTVKKQRVAARGLPSCAHVKREYDRMSTGQRWAAYMAATSAQVAHGKHCLGF